MQGSYNDNLPSLMPALASGAAADVRRWGQNCILALSLFAGSTPVFAAGPSTCQGPVTLADAEQRLLQDNADIRVARRAVDAANADLVTAGERPNPTLSLSSSGYDVQTGLGPGSAWGKPVDTMLQLQQPVERGGKRALRRDAAWHEVHASQADYRNQVRQSTLDLGKAFSDLRLASQKLDINHEVAALQTETLRAAERRLADGDISQADLARIKVEALKADNDVSQAQADFHTARVTLGYLIGCPADAQIEASGDWPAPASFAGDSADGAQRADVVAARQREEQARSAVDLARAAQTRDVSVSLQYEHYPRGVPEPLRGNSLVGVGISIPLFLAHAYEGELARALADQESSQELLARIEAQAAAEQAQARNELASASDRARNYREQILPQAQKAADAIEYAYAHGALPLLDLLDARRTLRSTRIEAVTAQSDYAKALARFHAATETYVPEAQASAR